MPLPARAGRSDTKYSPCAVVVVGAVNFYYHSCTGYFRRHQEARRGSVQLVAVVVDALKALARLQLMALRREGALFSVLRSGCSPILAGSVESPLVITGSRRTARYGNVSRGFAKRGRTLRPLVARGRDNGESEAPPYARPEEAMARPSGTWASHGVRPDAGGVHDRIELTTTTPVAKGNKLKPAIASIMPVL